MKLFNAEEKTERSTTVMHNYTYPIYIYIYMYKGNNEGQHRE